jgi:hypothetical protein
MGKLLQFKKGDASQDNLITAHPMEFRRARWSSTNFIQMRKSLSERYEKEFDSKLQNTTIPPHFVLNMGLEYTISALFYYRNSPEVMKEVYFLAGMVDLLINKVCPILRTDLIRGLYNKVFELRNKLNIFWVGPINQVLLPIEPDLYDESRYRASLHGLKNLKDLYAFLMEESQEMFLILCKEYVFYCPNPKGD